MVVRINSFDYLAGIEASVRSVFKKPLTSAVYALSMLVGVVAMLAFYESPGIVTYKQFYGALTQKNFY
jgi:hypothetical protein